MEIIEYHERCIASFELKCEEENIKVFTESYDGYPESFRFINHFDLLKLEWPIQKSYIFTFVFFSALAEKIGPSKLTNYQEFLMLLCKNSKAVIAKHEHDKWLKIENEGIEEHLKNVERKISRFHLSGYIEHEGKAVVEGVDNQDEIKKVLRRVNTFKMNLQYLLESGKQVNVSGANLQGKIDTSKVDSHLLSNGAMEVDKNQNNQKNKVLNQKVIALFHVYVFNKNIGQAITTDNCVDIAARYGWVKPTSGHSLYQEFQRFSVRSNRTNLSQEKREDTLRIEYFHQVVALLSDFPAALHMAKDEMNLFEGKFSAQYKY